MRARVMDLAVVALLAAIATGGACVRRTARGVTAPRTLTLVVPKAPRSPEQTADEAARQALERIDKVMKRFERHLATASPKTATSSERERPTDVSTDVALLPRPEATTGAPFSGERAPTSPTAISSRRGDTAEPPRRVDPTRHIAAILIAAGLIGAILTFPRLVGTLRRS